MHLRKKIGLLSMLLMMACASIPAHADTTKEPWTKSETQTQNLRIRDITTNGVHAQRVYNDGQVMLYIRIRTMLHT